jgi:hypothetical protein
VVEQRERILDQVRPMPHSFKPSSLSASRLSMLAARMCVVYFIHDGFSFSLAVLLHVL